MIQETVEGDLAAPSELQTDDLLESIGLWKGALTPPERAGHRSKELLVERYIRFERKRTEQNAMTFHDWSHNDAHVTGLVEYSNERLN